jgi:hypothetical protein
VRHWLRRLTANGKLKLLSLALALLLWAVVSAEQVQVRWLPVRVEVDLRDPRYALTGPPRPAVVNVRFAGPVRELWEMALQPPTVTLVVRDVGESGFYGVDPGMVRLPSGFAAVAQDVRPSAVRLPLQRIVARDVPVRVRLSGDTRLAWTLGDSVRVVPATVRVSGPRDRLAALDSVLTVPLRLAAGDTLIDRAVALDTSSLAGLAAAPRSVRVIARAEPRGARVVPVVVTPPGNAALAPQQVDVRIDGPARLVRAVDAAALRVVLAAPVPEPLPPDGVEVPVRVEGAPPGVVATPLTRGVHVAPLAPESPAAPAADSAPAPAPERRRR